MRFIDGYTNKISTLHEIKKDYTDDIGLKSEYKDFKTYYYEVLIATMTCQNDCEILDFTRKEVNRIINKLYAHAMKD